jgi:hypothetical protein
MASCRSFVRGFVVVVGVVGAFAVQVGCASSADSSKDPVDSYASELRLSSPKYLGPIADGETKTTSYANPPRYRAYGFSASGGDEITVTVKSVNGDAMGWLTTSSYEVLAANDDASSSTLDSKVVYTVPAGAAKRTYRVVFRDYDLLDATFSVKLAIKTSAPSCDPDAEPWRNYVGTPAQCMTIRYTCTSTKVPFQNDCGCGCESLSH